jgi:hypothetical protein
MDLIVRVRHDMCLAGDIHIHANHQIGIVV